jgi:hypothetical protein
VAEAAWSEAAAVAVAGEDEQVSGAGGVDDLPLDPASARLTVTRPGQPLGGGVE